MTSEQYKKQVLDEHRATLVVKMTVAQAKRQELREGSRMWDQRTGEIDHWQGQINSWDANVDMSSEHDLLINVGNYSMGIGCQEGADRISCDCEDTDITIDRPEHGFVKVTVISYDEGDKGTDIVLIPAALLRQLLEPKHAPPEVE